MNKLAKGLIVGTVTALLGVILGLTPLGADFEKYVGLDWLFHVRGPIEPPPEVAVVAINERDIAGLGLPKLPRDWPRSIHGELIEELVERGASVILFDMDFQRPKAAGDDAEFARAVAEAERVVLFERLNGKRQPIYDMTGQQTGTIWVEELVPPIPPLADAAKALAPFPVPKVQVNVYQYWPFKPSAGNAATLPSAALQVYALPVQQRWMEVLGRAGATGIENLPREAAGVGRAGAVNQLMMALRSAFATDPALGTRVREALAGDTGLPEGERRLMTALTGLYEGTENRYLNFYGPPGSIPNIPYNAVLGSDATRVPAEALDFTGKVVFVGLSDLYDPGQPDRFYTVFTNEDGVDLSGVEIAATAFSNLLTDSNIRPVGLLGTAVILVLVGLTLGAGIYLLRASLAVPLALLLSGCYVVSVQSAFNAADIWLPLAIPMLVQLPFALFVGLLAQYLTEARSRRQLKTVFGQYVPPEIVDEMSRNPDDDFSVEGESRELSVLFCDIRSFTTISESLAADELKQLLNYFFTPMTRIIFEQRGTIDKYVGDMIMAFWGAPVRDARHRQHAVEAALTMLDKLVEMQPELKERNWPEINIGIGINTGMMNVGDMGSEYRRAYTVIGDAVNLGSRLEGLTKYYGVRLIVSETTAAGLDGVELRCLDRVKVKGKNEPVTIFEPVGKSADVSTEQISEIRESNRALDYYFAGDWEQARAAFQALQDAMPGCRLYALYLERIGELQSQGVSKGWNGVFEHTSK
ncbi:MAG: adenylate/guanylate cyclase domain-containing protein [Gammaproteobacteria bacterium]|nr:adenylate/guanylate cyclase domain-containing protein [Gammaproteobacteria bacterium]